MTAFTAKIDGGAVVVPDDYRRALGLDDGNALLMEIHGEEWIANRRAEVAREEMSDRGESADG